MKDSVTSFNFSLAFSKPLQLGECSSVVSRFFETLYSLYTFSELQGENIQSYSQVYDILQFRELFS